MSSRRLHAAVADGDVNLVAQLLDRGANINQLSDDGWTPLLVAILMEGELPLRLLDIVDIRLELVTLLLDRGADVDAPDRSGETALHHLCRCIPCDFPYVESVLELLLDRGAAIDAPQTQYIPQLHIHLHECTALVTACKWDHVAIVRLLLERGADVHLRSGGPTPTREAYIYQHLATFRVLLEYGARLGDAHVGKLCPGLADENVALTAFIKSAQCVQRPVLPRATRLLTTWTLRIRLHVVGPRAENVGSARHRILGCRNLARHLVSFLSGPPPPPPHGASGLRGRLPKLAGFACVLQ